MILSQELLMSDEQAITATADSTNYIDFGAAATPHGAAAALSRDVGKGEPVPIEIIVTEVFNTLTSLDITIEVDDNTSFSSAKAVYTENVLLADLVVGKNIKMMYLPEGTDERYMQVAYAVNGTNPTTGKITAGVSGGRQTNQ
jgi:hypothetical protein